LRCSCGIEHEQRAHPDAQAEGKKLVTTQPRGITGVERGGVERRASHRPEGSKMRGSPQGFELGV
jgi:hypothetical protein